MKFNILKVFEIQNKKKCSKKGSRAAVSLKKFPKMPFNEKNGFLSAIYFRNFDSRCGRFSVFLYITIENFR